MTSSDLQLAADDRPYLPRGVRLFEDSVRGITLLMAPEKAMMLDDIAVAILSRISGEISFAQLVTELAQSYDAPRELIEQDVQKLMVSLRERLYLMVR